MKIRKFNPLFAMVLAIVACEEKGEEPEKPAEVYDGTLTIDASDYTSWTYINLKTGETSELEVQGIFVAIGTDPRTRLVHNQLELTADGTIAVRDQSSKTSAKGVFAAGDVIDSIYRQAIVAAGAGAKAALDAEHFLASLKD